MREINGIRKEGGRRVGERDKEGEGWVREIEGIRKKGKRGWWLCTYQMTGTKAHQIVKLYQLDTRLANWWW